MKQNIIFVTFFFLSVQSFSQLSHSVSLGPDLGIPTNSFGKAKLGLGGSLEYQIKFSGPVGAQLHIGYSSFTNKIYSDQRVTFLPVRAGVVGFIVEDLIFVSADAGISHYYSPSTGTKQDGFSFGAGFGYRYPISNNQYMQLSAYYNMHNFKRKETGQDYNYNWFNIRAAFGISWGKGKKIRDEDE